MNNINELFRKEFAEDKIVKLNTRFNKVAIQHIYWNIFGKKPKLGDIRINDKTSMLSIYGENILCWDRHHHYTKPEFLIYANYLFLTSVEETLQSLYAKTDEI